MLLPPSLFAAILPFIAPSLALSESVASNNASLLWGPYRPSLYLGIRPRVPESLLMGLMWGKLPESDAAEDTLRHNCDPSDGMASYGWTAYDTRAGGTQTIEDVQNQMNITTEFIKKHDGNSAGNWALRVRGAPRAKAPAGLKTSVIFYVGMEAMDSCTSCKLQATVEKEGQGDDLSVKTVDFELKHPRLGSAGIHMPKPQGLEENGRLVETAVQSSTVTTDKLWQSKSTFLELLKDEKLAPGLKPIISNEPSAGNMHFVQMNFENGFEFDVLYSTLTSTRAMTSAELTREVESTTRTFKKSFSYVFPARVPFNTDSHVAFAEAMFSNLLGGLGYFQGTSQVDGSHAAIYAETTNKFWEKSGEAMKHSTPETRGPYELLTHTPSRAVFPRGFLWDEGFHLLLVLDWDADLAIEVVRSWLALMDEDGWIAREQILGADAQSRTPEEYIVQYPHIANPPTMFWVISRCIDILQGKMKYFGRESTYLSGPETGRALIKELLPLLKKHYEWFRRTQSGDVEGHSVPSANLDEGYRWRGRRPEINLASGLDDYPRAEPPDVSELHIDALCWVGVMAQTLAKASLYLELGTDTTTLRDQIGDIRRNIEAVHWSTEKKLYCDTVVRDDVHTHVCAKGYISLFPFLTGFIDASHANLPSVLDLLHNPKLLWTDFGIRSLSADSPRYGVGDNYWRSPIWININFLIVERLYELARTPGPSQQRCKEIYAQLRRNLVNTVYNSYKKTGYAWEQYDPVGHGQRTQHFTGWTSLIVKIMAMPDMDVGEGVKGKMKDLYDEARVQVERNETWGVGSLVLVVLMLAFFYVYRRRFKGTLRGLRRKM